MVQSSRKKWTWILAIVISLLAILTVAIILLSWNPGILANTYEDYARKKIREAFPDNMYVDFDALRVDLPARSIVFENLVAQIPNADQSGDDLSLQVDSLQVSGIQLSSLLFGTTFATGEIAFRGGHLNIDKMLLSRADSSHVNNKKRRTPRWESLEIENLLLEDIAFNLKDSTSEMKTAVDIVRIGEVRAPVTRELQAADLRLRMDTIGIRDWAYTGSGLMYTASVRSFSAGHRGNLVIDTIVLEPRYDKYEFGRKAGKQTDRINLLIPQIELYNFIPQQLLRKSLVAERIIIRHASLHTFRDKNMPFLKNHPVPMPVNILRRLPYEVRVDTCQLEKARIAYEEMPEGGDSTGTIYFNDLYASLYHIHNRAAGENGGIQMDVRSAFMGNGMLNAHFFLPFDTVNGRYTASGKLTRFDLKTINPPVRKLAKLAVASGSLTEMEFDFAYNENRSDGQVILTYEDLKLIALTEEQDKNFFSKIKSFLLNTFIRKNKDESVKEEKRTGVVNHERDPKRSIFNYWWKSLLSGIKGSFGMEKLMSEKKDKTRKD